MTTHMPPERPFAAAMRATEEEARTRGHSYVDTTHLLLGILRQKDSKAVQVMATHGFTYDVVRDAFDALIPAAKETAPPGEVTLLKFSPKTAAVLENALSDAGGRTISLSLLLSTLLARQDTLSTRILESISSKWPPTKAKLDLPELQRQIRDLAQEESTS